MTPEYIILYEDGSWKLMRGNSVARGPDEEYWLNHDCDMSPYAKRYFYMIDEPCRTCGSVCPPGLKGLYLMMAML